MKHKFKNENQKSPNKFVLVLYELFQNKTTITNHYKQSLANT
jgi:hypothetical protein